jgi:LPXTG-site transpeptidase (sortase) family protein
MKESLRIFSATLLGLFIFFIPLRGSYEKAPINYVLAEETTFDTPINLTISSVGIHSTIVKVGTDKAGRMAVPSGKSNAVGWYEYGTVPGEQGSAVLASHNHAAFKNLKNVKIGDEIMVTAENGSVLKFRIDEIGEFALRDLSPEYLFNRADKKRVTLITCAGRRTSLDTLYSHRLVVSGTLVL